MLAIFKSEFMKKTVLKQHIPNVNEKRLERNYLSLTVQAYLISPRL